MALTKAKLEELIAAGEIDIPNSGGGGILRFYIQNGFLYMEHTNDYTGAIFTINENGELEVEV